MTSLSCFFSFSCSFCWRLKICFFFGSQLLLHELLQHLKNVLSRLGRYPFWAPTTQLRYHVSVLYSNVLFLRFSEGCRTIHFTCNHEQIHTPLLGGARSPPSSMQRIDQTACAAASLSARSRCFSLELFASAPRITPLLVSSSICFPVTAWYCRNSVSNWSNPAMTSSGNLKLRIAWCRLKCLLFHFGSYS